MSIQPIAAKTDHDKISLQRQIDAGILRPVSSAIALIEVSRVARIGGAARWSTSADLRFEISEGSAESEADVGADLDVGGALNWGWWGKLRGITQRGGGGDFGGGC